MISVFVKAAVHIGDFLTQIQNILPRAGDFLRQRGNIVGQPLHAEADAVLPEFAAAKVVGHVTNRDKKSCRDEREFQRKKSERSNDNRRAESGEGG